MTSPQVSVVLAVYNGAADLPLAVELNSDADLRRF